MTSSHSLRFTDRARRDIRSILRSSLATWGESQRDAYAARLSRAIDGLGRTPHIGRAREDVFPGVRSLPVGEHVIYYTADA